MKTRWAIVLPISAVTITCAYNPPPAPISGDAETIGFLAGEWSGTYESRDTGRNGSIYFRLSAGADTAQGEVLMAPSYDAYARVEDLRPGDPDPLPAIKAPPVVTIRFVRAGGEWIYGELDEYRDPVTGALLQTTFSGRIDGERIHGQFESAPVGTAVVSLGTWSADRSGPPPRPRALAAAPAARPVPGDTVGVGPDPEEMLALGRELFQDLGCAFCHGPEGRARIAPDLSSTLPHRSFDWVYRMILQPDSMVRNDPVAKGMYEQYELQMPDRAVTPWEALVLYEYMVEEVLKDPEPLNR